MNCGRDARAPICRSLTLAMAMAALVASLNAAAAPIEGMLTPRLSPDGEWVAVSHQGAIAKVRRAGGPLVILTRAEGWDSDPAWSPDGRRIAYVNSPLAVARGVFRILDASTGAEIAMPQLVPAAGPLWFHPDGRRVLGRFGAGPATRFGWVDVVTGSVTALSFGPPDEWRQQFTPYALSDDGGAIFFAVHPDLPGQQLGNEGSHAELFRAPAAGGAARLVTRFTARIYGLSADGRNRGVYAVTNAGVSHNDINGIVAATGALSADKLRATIDLELELDRSGWIALRTTGAAVRNLQGGNRAAHSNPIYVEVTGRPAEPRASAQYFLTWLDRLEQLLVARDRMDTERVHVMAHLELAREVYRGMMASPGR